MPAPANDDIGNATVLSGGASASTVDTTSATTEASEPSILSFTTTNTVWYLWTPDRSVSTVVETVGSGYDTLLAIYTGGPSFGSLSLVASDDQGGGSSTSKITFTPSAGTAYYIQHGGYNGASSATAQLKVAPTPANDLFADRIVIDPATGSGVDYEGTWLESTSNETSEPGSGNISVWYEWVAGAAGTATFDTIGSGGVDTWLGVYTGTTLAGLTLVTSNDDAGAPNNPASLVTWTAVSGTSYKIKLGVFTGSGHGVTKLNWAIPLAPITGTADFTGSGTLTTAGAPGFPSTAGFTGSGTLTTSGTEAILGTAAFSGSGTLTGAGASDYFGTAGFSGSGTLTTAASPSIPGNAALSGSGTLTAVGSVPTGGAGVFSGAGILRALGRPTTGAAGTLEVRLYDATGTGSYTVLPTIVCEYRDELSKRGTGRITVPVGDADSIGGRSIVKCYWQGAERFGFVVDADACTVAEVDSAEVVDQRIVEASGLGLLSLLGDAAVRPEYGLERASGDDRRFGYMSRDGAWHNNVTWAASIYTPVQLVDYPRWPVYPADFPDSAAAWIGVGNIATTPYYSWFRRQFTTARAYGAVRLAMCADDTVEWYLDGELLLNVVGDATILNSTYTADVLNLAPGTHVLAGRVTNAFQPRDTSGVIVVESADGEVVASLLEVLDPLTVTTGDPMYGDVLVRTDAGWECLNGDDGPPGWHWAEILRVVWAETLGLGSYLLYPTFDNDLDSDGVPWTDIQDITVPVGTSLLELVEMAGEVIDIVADPADMTWSAYVRKGADLSVSLTVGENLHHYETARTSTPVNVALVHLADGTWREVVDDTSVALYGGWIERRVDLGATADAATADQIAQAQMTAIGADQFAFTSRPALLTGATPYADYVLGDSVLVPGHRGIGEVLSRALAFNVTRNGENVEAWPELAPHLEVPSFGGSTGGGPAVDDTSPRDVYVSTPGTASSGVGTLHWAAPVTAGQTGYTVTLDGSHGTLPTPGSGATSGSLTGLTAGYVYSGTLTATYGAGPGVAVPFSFAADPAVIPAPSSTVFGTSANDASDVSRWAAVIGSAVPVVREFFGGALPSRWSASAKLASIPTTSIAVVSFKSGSAASVTAFLNTKPVGQVVYVSWAHEPEDDYTSAAAKTAYRAQWATYGAAIRSGGGIPMLILMAYTLFPGSGRDWTDWYQASAIDAFGWDAYNPAGKHSPPAYTDYATVMVPKFQAVKATTGKPYGITEHGSPVVSGTTDANRATWAAATHSALAGKAMFGIWWDVLAAGFDNTASHAVMSAWAP